MRFSDSDKQLFDGLSLQEPSEEVDRRILECAGTGRRQRGWRQLKVLALGSALAAGILILVTVFFASRHPRVSEPAVPPETASPETVPPEIGSRETGPPETVAPVSKKPVAQKKVRSVLKEIRVDLEQMNEMADLIPQEKKAKKDIILARIRACLMDLEKLELKADGGMESSFVPAEPRKEVEV